MTRQENSTKKERLQRFYAILAGVFAGFINGVFGGGGGMIIVPILIMLLKYQPNNAHATAILIILPISIVSCLFYVAFGSLDLSVALPVGGGVILGGIVGALILSKLSNKWLIIIFSVVMAVAGAKMLIF
ncbi:MAG: sulfite exporter TauE/SafE family protein [Clostridia bacterium]|nr:sulfite exporter TauE/SafE family protein [Clostridia bacterium]